MMFNDFNRPFVTNELPDSFLRLTAQSAFHDGHPHARRSIGQQSHPDLASQLQSWVFIIGYTVNISDRNSGLLQTITERLFGKCPVILDPREPLFLNGRNKDTILHKAAG